VAAVTVRALRAYDLDAADRVPGTAFGTFAGLAEPLRFFGDGDYQKNAHLAVSNHVTMRDAVP